MAARERAVALRALLAVGAAWLPACSEPGESADPASGGAGFPAGGGSAGASGTSGGSANTGGMGGAGAAGRSAGSSGSSGSGNGSGGSAGSAAGGGSSATAGAAGGSAGGGTGGSGGSAAASGTGGSGAGATGGASNAGASNGGGSGAGMGGSSGTGSGGSAGLDDDRCDVANQGSTEPNSLTLTGNLGTHDPVVMAAHGRYYLFSTGDQLGAKTSNDLESWQAAPEVWSGGTRPDWIADEVPGATNLWAPDISYFGGKYHLYYSASTFGCNVSCIGHATRDALDAGSWTDHGSVICSNPGATCQGSRPDNWNAIDPNVVVDRDGTPWLSFGSFWGGLKLFELDAAGNRVGNQLISIAARPDDDGALEAPFIVRRCGYYYLFLSWDTCCQGEDSTYNLRVGRSESVTGPYVDRQGTPLMDGGGTLVLAGDSRWKGPGHNAVIFTDDGAYNVYHAYDANNGNPNLRISELVFDEDGWPLSGGP